MPEQVLAPEGVDVCIDRVIPDHLKAAAKNAEKLEQGTAPELALQRQKKWKNGRKLKIRFLDGDPPSRRKSQRWRSNG